MVFFFKQKTAYEMRISDWSSDVCSSDLHRSDFLGRQHPVETGALHVQDLALQRQDRLGLAITALLGRAACGIALHQEEFAFRRIAFLTIGQLEIGRASGRERVCQYV